MVWVFRYSNLLTAFPSYCLHFFFGGRRRVSEDLEHDVNSTLESDQDQFQEFFARKLRLLHQFNMFINQQYPKNNHHDSPFISNFDQQRLLNVDSIYILSKTKMRHDQKLKYLEAKIVKLQQAQSWPQEDSQHPSQSKPKKFSFKKAPPSQPASHSTSAALPETDPTASTMSLPQASPTSNPLGLKPHSNNLFIRPSSPLQPLHSLALSDLSTVVLDLRPLSPHLSSLQLSRIRHAAVLAPPLSGSKSVLRPLIYLLLNWTCAHLIDLFFFLLNIQVRTYQSEDLVLLLHTRTGPVIERSTRLRIGPYPLKLFPAHSTAWFDPESSSSQHHTPQDFDCPERSTTNPSSNFEILSSSPIPFQHLSSIFLPPDTAPLELLSGCFLLPQSAENLLLF
ncbi:hypothetical protein VP01_237g10 [Puccinia sorghi]|uniref:Uncharacterized protein n=1 Tax=Puccinia sorghi TaxID=27349 RepID=A0A0L6V701_9BASI|nr:hypothetical protein VP01_237g10 [Puccinia sorghi]